ncbi:thiolase family protein [Lactobacillus gasseri]|uniref:acetyl-CoA C-acetyltransferase n=1 Tax=Lactobacillus gasseri TaxID=1596 RepID=A0A833CGD5_LACGS|nr:thiolase family protein [Lactobacillus gasseri]EEQ25891.1 acetyl-CoA C-acetyltransferase [Lactobacillus gasseri 202-4]EJN54082.1 Acetyl-CoA C-acetyltransferase [Lactobacillus gasseri CECT 5714]KAB1951093.1 thiolase family protein [Lactobacillus gasseri]KXA27378.1 acetyl-CoA C-acetyltransferase [Lactobacillus gasseri]MBV6740417.1 thiolase family protein [Lactobacillus gasseri CECT 5714]
MLQDVYIVGMNRIPFGKYRGFYKDENAVDLGVLALKGLLKKNIVAQDKIDNILIGNVLSAGLGQNVARQIALKSGLPESVVATSVDDVCGSSLKALRLAQGQMLLGDSEIAVVGGAESMTNAPLLLNKSNKHDENPVYRDSLMIDGIGDAYSEKPMGITAENVADKYQVTRQDMDEFARDSHAKAYAAQENNWFEEEYTPVKLNEKVLDHDETIRPDTSLDALGQLKPVFKENGRVTAGNSSPLTDGASMVLLANQQKLDDLDLTPLAYLGAYAEIGCDPAYMGYAPYFAIEKLLKETNSTIDDYDLVEINEAFAAQAYAVARDLDIPKEKLNIAGGAISLGHPLGATGTRLVISAVNSLRKINGRRAIVSLCIGGGQGIAYEIRRII